MTTETDCTPVIFRAERKGVDKGEVTAVFPTLCGTCDPNTFTVYAHIGQHSSGSPEWYRETRAAKPAEYASLLRELRSIYESEPDAVRLCVRTRIIPNYRREREKALAL